MTQTLARRERGALCATARTLDPSAPTLCEGWNVRDLLAHLVVREHSPLGAVGIALAPLAPLTARAMRSAERRPYEELVRRIEDVGLTPFRLGVVDTVANTMEYFVHHEDLRRAQPDWQPRELPRADEDALWSQLRVPALLSGRRAGVPLALERSDAPGATIVVRKGDGAVTVTARPSELALLMSGRSAVRDVTWDGPPEAVAKVQGADFSA